MAACVAAGRDTVRPVSERLEGVAHRLRAIEQRLEVLRERTARFAVRLQQEGVV